MESISLAIVIPAYNEESSIGNVVREIFSVLDIDFKIVVVSDYSSDNTSIIASNAGALVLDLKENHGYGGALNQGFQYVRDNIRPKYILTMDADGQHDPRDIQPMYSSAIANNFDLVVGKRPSSARFAEKLFAIYYQYKFNIADPLSGMKLYKADIYDEYSTFENFDSIGTELLTSTLLLGGKTGQVSINIRDRVGTSPRFGSIWNANKRIFLALIRSIYRIHM